MKTTNSARRRAAIMVVSLVMLVVVALVLGAMFKRLTGEQRQLRASHHQWQAHWLTRSAAERARARLAKEPDYRGETWQPSDMRGAAEIAVEPSTTELRIVARFPAVDSPLRARVAYSVKIEKP